MYEPLVPCPGCARHVRVRESDCPFCHAALSESLASRVIPDTRARLSRAAVAVFATALASACTSTTPAGHPPSVTAAPHAADAGDSQRPTPPTVDPTPDAAAAYPGPDDNGAVAAEYGAPAYLPPTDAGAHDSGDSGDRASPARDAGRRPPRHPPDWGTVHPMYGVPPNR